VGLFKAISMLPLNQVILGDCLEVMKTFQDNSIDIIWTDPPYGHNNNNGDLIANREEALGKGTPGEARPIANDSAEDMERVFRGMLKEAGRVLKRDCCCCCCCGGGGPAPQFAKVALWMDEAPMTFFHAVVWDKGGLGMGWRYRRNYEMVMVAHRRGGKLKWECETSGIETANVVRIGKIIPQADDHPTPKPVALIDHFLRLHGKPGDVMLDPFCGSGPALVAAQSLGIDFIGIELDQRWHAMAEKRIKSIQPVLF
jgi:DNA modification methylase